MFVLNTVGEYVIFSANCFHCGYFSIQSDSIYYTAQMFAMPSGRATQRSSLTSFMAAKATIVCNELTNLNKDILKNFDDEKYQNEDFKPPKEFDNNYINPKYHRVIRREHFTRLKQLDNFVKYFESKHPQVQIETVSIMAKSKNNSGFQRWHQDKMKLITTTIVVNIGIE
jgi:hypothetical protein